MQIRDLPAPVTTSKADWLAGTTWIGFTPTDDSLTARNMCQSTIQRQFHNGYVAEYITEQFSQPNPGFEHDPNYLQEREAHKELAGRLITVHRLRTTARALEEIIGAEDYTKIQDMWAQDGSAAVGRSHFQSSNPTRSLAIQRRKQCSARKCTAVYISAHQRPSGH